MGTESYREEAKRLRLQHPLVATGLIQVAASTAQTLKLWSSRDPHDNTVGLEILRRGFVEARKGFYLATEDYS